MAQATTVKRRWTSLEILAVLCGIVSGITGVIFNLLPPMFVSGLLLGALIVLFEENKNAPSQD